jgi:uncharacterized protein with PIN domain
VAEAGAGVLYADTSALVKLVVREAESEALEAALERWRDVATSAITAIELARAVARARTESSAVVADEWTVLGVLAATAEIPLSDDIRAAACRSARFGTGSWSRPTATRSPSSGESHDNKASAIQGSRPQAIEPISAQVRRMRRRR